MFRHARSKRLATLRTTIVGAALMVTLATGMHAHAAPITTLFNTGVNAAGKPLTDGTLGDPHYTLINVPSGSNALLVRTAVGGFPIPPYIGDNSLSAWIGPNNDTSLNGPVGAFIYETTFSLAGLDPLSARITGGWSSDNAGVRILLNGVDTGNPGTSSSQFSLGFAPVSITSGFVAGLNKLDFVVNNDGGPTALRVEVTGTASAALALVPEPASLSLLALATLGLLRLRRAHATG